MPLLNTTIMQLNEITTSVENNEKLSASDESMIKHKSKRNKSRLKIPTKPTSEGWCVHRIADSGECKTGFVLGSVVHHGEYTYTDKNEAKVYNILKQLTKPYWKTGRLINYR